MEDFDMNRNDRNDAYEFGDDMTYAASHCSRFTRRNDINAFNMANYQSCENCRHMTADNTCIVKQDGGIPKYQG